MSDFTEVRAREVAKPVIYVGREYEVMLADAREVLESAEGLFRHGQLARIARDDDGRPVIKMHTSNSLAELLDARSLWMKRTANGEVPITVPGTIVGRVIDSPDVLNARVVNQVVSSPVFASDGSLITEPGYVPGAHAWFEPIDGMILTRDVPKDPTADDLITAKTWLAGVLCDFPFTGVSDYLHATLLVLQPFVRSMISGPTPLFEVESPTAGTGKGKLVEACSYIPLGYKPPSHVETDSTEEWRKSLFSFHLSGQPVYFLDNVKRYVESGALASALTQEFMMDRLLGVSRQVTVPVRCTWVMTANNPRLSGEIARRCVQIRLDSKMARPHTRRGFRHPDLLGWVQENRGWLVWSALTLVQSWVAAGRPVGNKEVDPVRIGSFEGWCDVMGGIARVIGAGEHFLANREAFWGEHDDDDTAEVCVGLAAWWNLYGDRPVTVSQIADINVLTGDEGIHVKFWNLLVDGGAYSEGKSRQTALAAKLRELRLKILCDWRIELGSKYGGRQTYVLRRMD